MSGRINQLSNRTLICAEATSSVRWWWMWKNMFYILRNEFDSSWVLSSEKLNGTIYLTTKKEYSIKSYSKITYLTFTGPVKTKKSSFLLLQKLIFEHSKRKSYK